MLTISFEKLFNSSTKVEIINSIGSIVGVSQIEKNELVKEISINHLAAGLYTLKLSNKEGTLIQKITIQR